MNTYIALSNQIFKEGQYSIVPIRYEDRFLIKDWRNQQIYHLRQSKLLSEEDQNIYFDTVVAKLFHESRPSQLLFSFLHNGICVGYGGLVHINWLDKNAEISFLMNTALENEYFEEYWTVYLILIEEVAFNELKLHKIFTYAFDLRSALYPVLLKSSFEQEARLNEHVFYNNCAIDVLIHGKVNQNVKLISATNDDLLLTYNWANNSAIRQYSFSRETISLPEHTKWFNAKLEDQNCLYYICTYGAQKVGSIRVDITKGVGQISYLVDPKFQGKGLGFKILSLVENECKSAIHSETLKLVGKVLDDNIASKKIFLKLGYSIVDTVENIITFSKNLN
jgi:RimJ/RimL family protein N-acetyltransferase